MALYPAVIKEYDAKRRKVRIEMVGMTDGDTLLPESDLMYSLGDKSKHTEIEILTGDMVWVDFLANDPRYPIIVGYRSPEVGNVVNWRKWHHSNIELAVDDELVLKGKNLKIEFETINTTGITINNSQVTNKSPVINEQVVSMNNGIKNDAGGSVLCSGGLNIQNGDVDVDGVKFKEHIHSGVRSGGDKIGTPE